MAALGNYTRFKDFVINMTVNLHHGKPTFLFSDGCKYYLLYLNMDTHKLFSDLSLCNYLNLP